jgi:general secretion pathway protein B
MSYILDAIKRSEQQRQRAAAPSLGTAAEPANSAQKPSFMLYGIASATLITAGVLIGWLGPWRQGDASAPALAPKPAIAQPIEIARPMVAPEAENRPAKAIGEPQADAANPFSSKVAAPARKRRVSPSTPAVPASGPEKKSVSVIPAPSDGKIIAMHELPPDILLEIPKLAISGYSYSTTTKERVVAINDRLVQEGQYVADGLKLEQITQDSLVFSYKNYRFRKRL